MSNTAPSDPRPNEVPKQANTPRQGSAFGAESETIEIVVPSDDGSTFYTLRLHFGGTEEMRHRGMATLRDGLREMGYLDGKDDA